MKLTFGGPKRFGEPMLFVEDVITDFAVKIEDAQSALGERLRENQWNRKFILSLAESVKAKRALSSEQSRVFLKLVRDMKSIIVAFDDEYCDGTVSNFLEYPRHRQPPYQSSYLPKEVRYLGDNKLGFRFKRNDEILRDIKALRNRVKDTRVRDHMTPTFHRQARMWIVPVTRETIKGVMNLIRNHNFKFDEAVWQYLLLAENSRGEPSRFVYDPESGRIIVNVCDNDVLAAWIRHVLFGELV